MNGTKLNAYSLANLADCGVPAGLDSAGAKFLLGVAEDVAEREDFGWDEDAAHEIADGAVPVYTTDRWAAFTDLAGWSEDVDEYGDVTDLTQAAGVALYMIADRLVSALHTESRS